MLINYQSFKRKIIYKSCNRGWKETDILLGNFAKKNIDSLNEQQLINFDRLLDESDVDIFNWIAEKAPVPEHIDKEIIEMIRKCCK